MDIKYNSSRCLSTGTSYNLSVSEDFGSLGLTWDGTSLSGIDMVLISYINISHQLWCSSTLSPSLGGQNYVRVA